MTDVASNAAVEHARASELGPVARSLKATELDTRMLGMVAALLIIWVGIHFLSGGLFLTPRNLWNLSVQSSSIALMAASPPISMNIFIVTQRVLMPASAAASGLPPMAKT